MADEELDPIIHQPTRLRIMVVLYRNRDVAATWLRDALQLTDGNLGSHCQRLAEAGYVDQGRALTKEGFHLRLRITAQGDAAFSAYLAALKSMLNEGPADPGPPPAAPG